MRRRDGPSWRGPKARWPRAKDGAGSGNPGKCPAGRTSGRDGDKFDRLGIQAVPCQKIKPPRIAEAPIHLECRVKDRHPYPGISLFVAEVLHTEAEEAVFDGHRLILENLKTLHHISGGVFAVTDRALTIPR